MSDIDNENSMLFEISRKNNWRERMKLKRKEKKEIDKLNTMTETEKQTTLNTIKESKEQIPVTPEMIECIPRFIIHNGFLWEFVSCTGNIFDAPKQEKSLKDAGFKVHSHNFKLSKFNNYMAFCQYVCKTDYTKEEYILAREFK